MRDERTDEGAMKGSLRDTRTHDVVVKVRVRDDRTRRERMWSERARGDYNLAAGAAAELVGEGGGRARHAQHEGEGGRDDDGDPHHVMSIDGEPGKMFHLDFPPPGRAIASGRTQRSYSSAVT